VGEKKQKEVWRCEIESPKLLGKCSELDFVANLEQRGSGGGRKTGMRSGGVCAVTRGTRRNNGMRTEKKESIKGTGTTPTYHEDQKTEKRHPGRKRRKGKKSRKRMGGKTGR